MSASKKRSEAVSRFEELTAALFSVPKEAVERAEAKRPKRAERKVRKKK